MRYAVIENNVVVNVIVATPEFVQSQPSPDSFILLGVSEVCEIDMGYDPDASPRFIGT